MSVKVNDTVLPERVTTAQPTDRNIRGRVVRVSADGTSFDVDWYLPDNKTIVAREKGVSFRPVTQPATTTVSSPNLVDFMKRPVVGPVPVWGVMAGGTGLVGVITFLFFKLRKR